MKTIKLPTGTFEYDPAKPLGRRGGFGQVFAGKSASGGDVVVKKLHLSAADAAHRELQIADELKGRAFEHVVPFIDAGQDADTGDYFFVMPKAEESLQNVVNKKGLLAPDETAAVLLEIAKGLIEVGELVRGFLLVTSRASVRAVFRKARPHGRHGCLKYHMRC
jgi:eukaryotic-like serine/threonine-protein kinase